MAVRYKQLEEQLLQQLEINLNDNVALIKNLTQTSIANMHEQNVNLKDLTGSEIKELRNKTENLKNITDSKIDGILQNITVTMPDGQIHEGNMTYILNEL